MSASTERQQESAPIPDTTLLRALMELERLSPEGCLFLAPLRDPAGTITDFECLDANLSAESILGPIEGGLSGQPLRKLLPERDAVGWVAVLCAAETSGQSVSAELSAARPDNRGEGWLHCTAMKLRGFLVARFRDVSASRRTDEALQRTRDRMVEILEGNPGAFFSVDANWNFTYVNERTEGISGSSREQMLGHSLWEMLPKLAEAPHEQVLRRIMAERAPNHFELKLPPDHWYDVHAYPSGQGLSAFFREIREQKRLEAERDALLAREYSLRLEAEALAQHRAKELFAAQEKLVQSEKLAVAGQFAAGVGHEINNPLSFVIGNLHFAMEFLEGLGEPLPDAEVLQEPIEALKDARAGAERIRAILTDLKRFARADESLLGPVDVREALEFSISMAMPHIRHRAQVERRYSPVPTVLGNEAKLGQVFLNLLMNAAQAIPEGDVARHRITLTTRMENARVVVEVSDTGRGMTPEVLERAFQPFFTTRNVGDGMGLGLSICLGLVQSMKGEMSATSRLGIGSTFRVVLPTSTQPAPMLTPMSAARASRPKRVLVIDDEPGIAAVFKRIIGRSHEVVVVQSGREALALLERDDKFDRIFCDLMMADLTGMDVYEALSSRRQNCLDRFVFMTGGSFTERARTFLQTMPFPRIDKPFDPEHIRTLVAQAPATAGPRA
ncbi:hybrid sensor histidine kinase/response regulator [Hyalangium versicolor]|uniref:hybrid sensor histidine kinase/response regulator n=1 Tax=Hyalangium versicolor TaxID=2861190 RepID=UPI001CCFD79B|nr:ATP-binding protein [Hyalangium versicolor]